MKKERKYWVRFFSPGIITAENWTKDVESPDPNMVEWPENAYAFTIHKRDDILVDNIRYKGEDSQVGFVYYHPDSKIETLEEVRRNPIATSILISNMKCNEWDKIIWTRWGNWPQPYDVDKCVVLSKPSEETMADAEKHTCCQRVSMGLGFHFRPCGKTAKYERDGKWYCGIHDPKRVKTRREKRDAKRAAKIEAHQTR